MRCGALAWRLTEVYVEMDVCADVVLRSIRVSGFGDLMRGGALACRLRLDAMVHHRHCLRSTMGRSGPGLKSRWIALGHCASTSSPEYRRLGRRSLVLQ